MRICTLMKSKSSKANQISVQHFVDWGILNNARANLFRPCGLILVGQILSDCVGYGKISKNQSACV